MSPGDLLVYADLARWEIQLRYRRGMGNYRADNGDEDILKKYKRGFFVEWRIADKHKAEHFESIGYLLDTNRSGEPKMISGRAFRTALGGDGGPSLPHSALFRPGRLGGTVDERGLRPGRAGSQFCLEL